MNKLDQNLANAFNRGYNFFWNKSIGNSGKRDWNEEEHYMFIYPVGTFFDNRAIAGHSAGNTIKAIPFVPSDRTQTQNGYKSVDHCCGTRFQ